MNTTVQYNTERSRGGRGSKVREGAMNDATLQGFRDLADAMAGPEPRDWEWVGAHMSQRMFGITERRAKDYAETYGGVARKMERVR